MQLTEIEVESLRRYLLAGGFLFIDDFWGSWEWRNFEREIGRVLPERRIVDLPIDHPLFHSAPWKGGVFPVGARPTRQLVAPAGSNRSGGGGNKAAEAFGVEGRHGRLGENAGRNRE